jgi:hypothetical protein
MLNDRTVRAVMVVIVIFVILGLIFSSIQFAL